MVGIQIAEIPEAAFPLRRAHAAMKFPIKVRLCRTFIPLPAPCKGEGVIRKSFLGNFFGI